MVKEVLIGLAAAVFVFLVLQGVDVVPFLLIGGFILLLRFMIEQREQGKRFELVNVGSERRESTGVTFADIGGQEVAKREFLEALDFLKDRKSVQKLGIRPLKGILLAGPPGTGKTLLAKAAASYVDAVFISTSGSQFVEMYAGVGAQRIRKLFRQAREMAQKQEKPYAIIFIDEIEVLGGKRGKHTSHLEYDQTLNELLVQMDGMASQSSGVQILVVAATNRPDLLDSALLRPGRFDRTVYVELPDREGRRHILNIHTRGRPLADDVDLDMLAQETYGFSGAHLESLVNEAAILALREKKDRIELQHFKEAVEKVMMGEKLDRKPRQEERERIAYHEAGHALLSEVVRPGSVSSITITSRGKALGYMRQAPENDPYLYTKDEMLDQIAVCLAGAVAEEVFFGSRSTGSIGDFEQAVDIAERLISAGMSDLGIINPETIGAQRLHAQVQRILREQEHFVQRQIEACRDKLQTAACLLLERERLSGDEFREIIGHLVPLPRDVKATDENSPIDAA